MLRRLITYVKQDMKLRNKLLLIQILTVLVPAVITTGIFYSQFYKNTLELVLESRLNTVSIAGAQIEDTISQLREISAIISNTDLLNQALTIEESVLQEAADGNEEVSIEFLDTYKAVLSYQLEDAGISSICIFCDEPTDLLNQLGTRFTDAVFFQPLSQIAYSYWLMILRISGENSRLFPGYYLSDNERENYGDMSYVQKVNYSKDGVWKEAYVAVYRDAEIFENLPDEQERLEGEFACVIDARNVIVTPYAQNEDIGLYVVSYEDLDETFPETKKFYRGNYGKDPAYVCRYDFSDIDWSMIWVIPVEGIAGESRQLLLRSLCTYGSFLLIGIGVTVAVSWSLLNRIYRLKSQMEKVRSGRPAVLEGEIGKDEIGVLQETYNYMVRQVNDSVDRELKAQEEMNDLRIDLLRAQIDPHFLYNTLDLLRGFSRQGEKDKVEELVLSLTGFYRLALNKGKRFSTVEREMMLAENYMKIMNMRFGDQIAFAADMAEDILDDPIPVLLFQPILENSIVHGILEKENRAGNISLTGWREDQTLVFLISDDGVGMDEETRLAALEGKHVSRKGSSIGVYNTLHRLQLIYGEGKSSLVYRSSPGEGTDAEIRIPISEEDIK